MGLLCSSDLSTKNKCQLFNLTCMNNEQNLELCVYTEVVMRVLDKKTSVEIEIYISVVGIFRFKGLSMFIICLCRYINIYLVLLGKKITPCIHCEIRHLRQMSQSIPGHSVQQTVYQL